MTRMSKQSKAAVEPSVVAEVELEVGRVGSVWVVVVD